MPLELMLAWLWLIGIVAFVILVGWVWQGRREEPHGVRVRLVPSRLELFHQRRRQPHPIMKRLSRLS